MSEEEQLDEQPVGLRKSDVIIDPKFGVPECYTDFFAPNKQPAKPKTEGEEQPDGEAPAPEKEAPKAQPNSGKPNVIVTVKQRNKRKNITSVENLESWDIDIKDFSKYIAKKLAVGCSTETFPVTGLGIIINGDVGESVIHIISNQFGVPIKSVTAVRKVKKAPEPKQPAAQPQFDLNNDDNSSDDGSSDSDEAPKDRDEDEHHEEEEIENPNHPSKKQKKKQQQQQQHHEKKDEGNHNEDENNEESHGGNREYRGRGGNRGGRGGNRGGHGGYRGRGGNRGGRGKH